MKSASVVLSVLGLSTALLHAQGVPALMSYQGRVVDSAGVGLGTGTPLNRKIIFRLFDAATGGNRLWSEEQTATLANGDFSVILGQGVNASFNGVTETPRPSLLTVFGGTDRYLEIVVDNGDNTFNNSDTPIAPRQRLISTAFALRAATADSVASGTDLVLKDANYGLGWYGTGRLFNGINVDGPVLYGSSGGVLGSVNGATQSAALRWDNSGRVSIGSGAAPTEKLDVTGNIKASGSISANGNSGFVFNSGGDIDGGLFSPGDGIVTLKTNNLERLRVDSNGNLGIANNAPAEKLDVTGNAKVSGNLTTTGSVVSTGAMIAKAGLNFGTNSFGANPTEGGSNGNFIAFGSPSVSEDFLGYAENVFYFKDSPSGGDSTQPSVVVGNNISAGGNISASGTISATGNLSAANINTGNLTLTGNQTIGGTSSILLKDVNHGLGWYGTGRAWNGINVDGPVLYGYSGGALGTNSGAQATALRWNTAGDVTVTGNLTAAGKSVATGEENLRIIRGTINGNGTIKVGSGFTVTGTNAYTITFTTAFSAEPSVTATPAEGGYLINTVNSTTKNGFVVESRLSDNHNFAGGSFSFIAVGPR